MDPLYAVLAAPRRHGRRTSRALGPSSRGLLEMIPNVHTGAVSPFAMADFAAATSNKRWRK